MGRLQYSELVERLERVETVVLKKLAVEVNTPKEPEYPANWMGRDVDELTGEHARNILKMLIRNDRIRGKY